MMALLPVDDAIAAMLDGVERLGPEKVAIDEAAGRVLAAPLKAMRTQPPFDASAMDGYAVRAADLETVPARLRLVGESAAGKRHPGPVNSGETVRIFTGAPLPEGAEAILIQENARKLDAGLIEAIETVEAGRHIRRAGLDFSTGDALLEDGRRLDPAALSLAAAANHAALSIVRKPRVAVLATGSELVAPGAQAGPDQIVASNGYGIAAIAREAGAEVLDMGIVHDDRDALGRAIRGAFDAGADVIVTLGGASVGDHDLVREVLVSEGIDLAFWKIAMRPGKPLMFGRKGATRVLGLPGNPVSSLVGGHVFLKPLLARLGGHAFAPAIRAAILAAAMNENDQRRDYVRARSETRADGLFVTPFPRQDSSMLTTLAEADCLIMREPFAAAAEVGEPCRVLMLR